MKSVISYLFAHKYTLYNLNTQVMEAIHLEDKDNQFLISISKEAIDKGTLIKLLEQIRIEFLSGKANLNKSAEQIGEEIKSDWWSNNKAKWIKEV